jgi:PAS domain S-box-containing protein
MSTLISRSTRVPTPWKVVLVDDSTDVRDLVRLRLEGSGVLQVVAEAGDGREAIDLARAHQPDLLLLDISMPEMDGIEALPLIREASPRTRVVVFSGFEGSDVEQQVRALGAVGFYDKSVSLKDLTAALIDLLGASSAAGLVTAEDVDDSAERAEAAVFDDQIERFRAAFDEAAIGMATLTLNGRFVRLNGAMAGLLGGPVEDFVGKRYAELLAPMEARALNDAFDTVVKRDRRLSQLEHMIIRNHAPQVVLSTVAPIRDSAGRPLYLFLQVQDLSEQRRTMDALMASEQQFRLLVDAVVDYALFMLDPNGVISSWNPGAERIKGYAASEIIGQHFRVFYTPEAQAARHPEHELEQAAATGRYEEEGWRVRKDGTQFWANVVITPVKRDGMLVGFAKVTRDHTARRQAQVEQEFAARTITEANAALTSASHDLAEVLSVTAHEMRGPVGLIRGYAEMLRDHHDGGVTSSRDAHALAAIVVHGERLARLIDDLLTAARLDGSSMTMHFEVVDVHATIASVTAALTSADAAGIQVSGPRLFVRADRVRLVQILNNYISNALRHGRPPIRIDTAVAGEGVIIYVRDAGPGVSADMRPRLFEKFSRPVGAAKPGGIGLGLFIVRGLARAQGGDAWYDAAGPPCFAVRLPMASDSAVAPSG